MGNLDDIYIDPTLAAIDRLMVENHKPRKRTSIGAGDIGEECERLIWYTLNNIGENEITAATLCAFEDGHKSEAEMAKRLKMVPGLELWTIDDQTGKQYGFKDLDGKYKGYIDGVVRGLLQAPKTLHVWDHKAVNEKKFGEFEKTLAKWPEKEVLKNWDYKYYCQAVVYMDYFDMDRHYLTVSTPGCRKIKSCRTEANKRLAEALKDKAKRIIAAKEPPERISNTSAYYKCKFCWKRGECWK